MSAKQYEVFQIVRERLVEILRLAILAKVLVHRAFDWFERFALVDWLLSNAQSRLRSGH